MKKQTQKFALSIVLGLLVISSSSALAEETLPAPVGTDVNRPDAYLLKFQDGDAITANTNAYIRPSVVESSTTAIGGYATTLGNYKAVLPLCDEINKFGCIQKVEMRTSLDATWEELIPGDKFWNSKIAAYTTTQAGIESTQFWSSWSGQGKSGLPPSGKVQLFNSSRHSHGGGNSYVVKALMSGYESEPGSFTSTQFGLSVIPVQVLKYDPTSPGSREVFSVKNYRFPKNLEVRITIRLGNLFAQLNGWFFGRVKDAQLVMNANEKILTVSGRPSITPVQHGFMPFPVPEKFKGSFFSGPDDKTGNLPVFLYSPSNSRSVESWLKFREYLNPKANHESEVWQIDATSDSSYKVDGELKNCLKKKTGISGLLTTNATSYNSNPPTWNSKDSTLTYQVAGPELLSDGTKNLGNYLLAIRSDVASCLWKSDLKNARATVEVTNGDGSSGAQVATTTMSQKNGWVYFTAAGFHFSAPSITVKLNPQKVMIIACIKGKTKKTVSGSNPKCPAGYKKS